MQPLQLLYQGKNIFDTPSKLELSLSHKHPLGVEKVTTLSMSMSIKYFACVECVPGGYWVVVFRSGLELAPFFPSSLLGFQV